MSETTEPSAGDAAPEPQSQIEPGTEAEQAEVSQGESGETQPVEPTEQAAEPEKPAAKQKDRRFAHLTARIQAEAEARAVAERRAEAAEALLRANRPGGDEAAPRPPQPVPDVRAEARRLVEEERFNARLAEIDAAGKVGMGGDQWEAAKATLTSLGAVNNQDFLRALAKTKAPERVFAALADDTDRLMDILKETPAGMGAMLGEMGAELSRPSQAVKTTSNAPRPPAPVHTSSAPVQPTAEQLAKSASVDDYVAQLKKEFPGSKLFSLMR